MRLIRTIPPLQLEEFADSNIPRYAILSHRWEDDEISFQDMANGDRKESAGYMKIERFCARAADDGYAYAWADTCCINKESSAELSEAINSMFRWYQLSERCYAYLSDVTDNKSTSQFQSSQWFSRGWTLQELIAPSTVLFFSRDWSLIGSKDFLCDLINDITNIDRAILYKPSELQGVSIAKKMSWASHRVTTRTEDLAYCLLGIFNVNMPLLYGEGDKAFIRLQEEILKDSDDQTLFAWEHQETPPGKPRGLFAHSPAEFKSCGDIVSIHFLKATLPSSSTNRGIRLQVPLITQRGKSTVVLECQDASGSNNHLVGIELMSSSDGDSQFVRVNHSLTRNIPFSILHQTVVETVYVIKNLTGDEESLPRDDDEDSQYKDFSRPQKNGMLCGPGSSCRKLVICFEGASFEFEGTNDDSNILKIYRMLDRSKGFHHFHYQAATLGDDMINIEKYVIGAYKFLMKVGCTSPDEIFIFGFSIGAYAAQLLVRMIEYIGIVNGGDEEMADVAWDLFQDFNQKWRGPGHEKARPTLDYAKAFRETFCRPAARVSFLGLFDAVKKPSRSLFSVDNTALIIRHAISIDERQAHLRLDPIRYNGDSGEDQDIEEVWFAGGHLDIGGRFPLGKREDWSLGHVPLVWMVREAESAGVPFDKRKQKRFECSERGTKDVFWNDDRVDSSKANFKDAFRLASTEGRLHDELTFGRGSSILSVIGRNIIEYLPSRDKDTCSCSGQTSTTWTIHKRRSRYIPSSAAVHASVLYRMQLNPQYRPANLITRDRVGNQKTSPEEGIGEWAIFRKGGDIVREYCIRKM